MKVILLFDGGKLDNLYREYEIDDSFAELGNDGWVSVTFCHPEDGEVFMVKEAKKKISSPDKYKRHDPYILSQIDKHKKKIDHLQALLGND